MADRYWVNDDADGDWNNANNWSASDGGAGGAGVPTNSDDVYFTASETSNCTPSANASCHNFLVDNQAYTGLIDLSTYDVHFYGDVSIGSGNGAKIINYGSGSHTVDGSFEVAYASSLINSIGTATWTLTGESKTFASGYSGVYRAVISGSMTASRPVVANRITVETGGSLTVTQNTTTTAAQWYLESGASITVNSGVTLQIGGWYWQQLAGTLTVDGTLYLYGYSNNLWGFPAGDVTVLGGGLVRWGIYTGTKSVIPLAGTHSFPNVQVISVSNAAITVANNTNNPNWSISGDVTITPGSGSVTWTPGTGTITLSGAADQAVNFLDKTIEDIVINKSTPAAKVTFTNGWVSDSFTLTQGTLAFDATGATLETVGNWTIGANGQVDPTNLDGWTWAVGGDLSLSGEVGDLLNLVATAAWYLEVTGTAAATYVDVDYSDASGYTEIDASDGTNVDRGNNMNWDFGAAVLWWIFPRNSRIIGCGLGA